MKVKKPHPSPEEKGESMIVKESTEISPTTELGESLKRRK
jgi:hypothetical protein